MKRLIYIYVVLLVTGSNAQVGINTSNPQQSLHIGGVTENVRMEGLNDSNNSKNLGPDSSSRVYVNANGDLVLGNYSNENAALIVDSSNYLNSVEDPTSHIIQTGANIGYSKAGIPTEGIVGASFTLTQNAVLEINYAVSWSIYDAIHLDFKRLADVRARVVRTGLYFYDHTTGQAVINNVDNIPINGGPWCIEENSGGNCLEYAGLVALTGQFYNNASLEHGAYKDFQNTASDYVRLGPGTYTAMFAGRVQVEVTTGAGAAKVYLGSGDDTLQIMAYYYQ